MSQPTMRHTNVLDESNSISTTVSIELPQLAVDPMIARMLEQGGTTAFILALAVLVGMLNRFVETIKKQ